MILAALYPVITAAVFSVAGGLAIVTIGHAIAAALRDTL